MSNLVRRLVSGNKARFKDAHLDVELDLVYVTDQIIIMGFPAIGIEGLYRNHREDAKRFLEHRHGKNYWIFNFCPLRENSYPASFFDGRVSRYPFPDHHAPPLAIIPLFVREAREWLGGSTDRVAILHCKAGKGRSGTLACAYLLSLDESPSAPKLQRSMTKNEWAKQRADQVMETVETEGMNEDAAAVEKTRVIEEKSEPSLIKGHTDSEISSLPESADSEETIRYKTKDTMPSITGKPTTDTPPSMSPPDSSVAENIGGGVSIGNAKTKPNTLDDILALHTARRMKTPSAPDKKLKQGVSIPSQRRWLHYWALLFAHAAPRDLWEAPMPRIRLRAIQVRLRELGGVKMNFLKVANALIEKTTAAKHGVHDKGDSRVWVSLARYDDEFVRMLEKWEKYTRSEDGNLGKRQCDAEQLSGDMLRDVFTDGKWDKGKMIRSFTRFGSIGGTPEKERSEEGQIVTHTLRPLSDQKWEVLQEQISEPPSYGETRGSLSAAAHAVPSTASSVTDLAQVVDDSREDEGVILDAGREVRAKLYMGQVFMGWFWFVPAFHMPPPPTGLSAEKQATTHFVLTRKEVDFAIGAGAAIIDVDVAMDWVSGPDSSVPPPKTQTSEDSAKGEGGEPAPGSIVAGLQTVMTEASGREAVEAAQASNQ